VLEWLDGHERFARANKDAVECLEESLSELRERSELSVPKLRSRATEPGERRRLRRALAEAANCIQTSD
jgi:hypothetical protein